MNFLPKASGTRPRLACEISPQGVVAARSAAADGPVTAVARVELRAGAVSPGLKPGNIVDRVAVTAAMRKALEAVGAKPNARDADLGLIVPDSAVRVLLLDFDALPNKLTEALPIVRFRLKKLLPFDADEAMLNFQIMSSGKAGVRVLAVAVPRDVLSEYETAAREAGFEPGAVLPSTLAALAAVQETSPALLVNATTAGITTAIVREGILLLHLSVDLQLQAGGVAPTAAQAAITAPSMAMPDRPVLDALPMNALELHVAAASEPGAVANSPYASPTLLAELDSEMHNAILVAPTSLDTLTEDASGRELDALAATVRTHVADEPTEDAVPEVASADLQAIPLGEEIAQAVSKGAAYYEDTLAAAPTTILSAGTLGADKLRRILADYGVAEADGLRVREVVESDALSADAATASVPRGWMAGVVGALRG